MEFNFYLKKYILVTFGRKWPVFAKSEIIRLRVSLCIHSEDLCENNQKVLNLSHFTASCLSTSLVSIPDYKKKRKRSKNWVQMFCVLYYKLEGATAYELTNFSVTHRRIRLDHQTWHLLGDRGPGETPPRSRTRAVACVPLLPVLSHWKGRPQPELASRLSSDSLQSDRLKLSVQEFRSYI